METSLLCLFIRDFVMQDTEIGTVGNTGNAISTLSHLHYGIGTLVLYPWRIDGAPLGWQKMLYINPIDFICSKISKSQPTFPCKLAFLLPNFRYLTSRNI